MMVKTSYLRGLVVLAAVALAGSLLVAVAAGKPAQASFPGTNGLIAFVSDRDSAGTVNDDIYVMNPDGSNPTRLTSAPSRDRFPAVSPNGKEVAFLSNRDGAFQIYVMDAKDDETLLDDGTSVPGSDGEGDHLRALSGSAPATSSPLSWSPDGKRIAFTMTQGGNTDIYVIPADDSETPTRLTNHASGDAQPRFSPNGQEIAFLSNRDSAVGAINFEIYKMKAEPESTTNNSPTRLTDNSADDRQPDFSPDGARMAFTSNRDGDYDIYVMKAEPESATNNSPANLTNTNVTNTGASLNDRYPSWSPDETKIAFWSGTGSGLGSDSEILVMNAQDGSGQQNLTKGQEKQPAGDIEPNWGPAPEKEAHK